KDKSLREEHQKAVQGFDLKNRTFCTQIFDLQYVLYLTDQNVPLRPDKLDDVSDDELVPQACANELDDGSDDYDPDLN
ncbi:hypothetical protein ILUMI_17184, partial [Ignelater luminosus]